MKYFVIAGERSGDLHASKVCSAIFQHDTAAEISGWGGAEMKKAGVTILRNYESLAFMGFLEVLLNIFKILGFFKECKQQINDFQPDAIIFVDYAGFNLRMAKWAKLQGYKTFYYIAPKTWAWNPNRTWKLKRFIDKLFVIFPFEVTFFKKYELDATYVGNPLLDAKFQFKKNDNYLKINELESKPIVAILPGSRKQEVKKHLPDLLILANKFPEYQFVVGAVRSLPDSFYDEAKQQKNVSLVYDSTYDLLQNTSFAVVVSGTATLETALFNVPQVVVYRTSWLSYQIAKRLITVPYISLVNLLAEKKIVEELIQENFTENTLFASFEKCIDNRSIILEEYQKLHSKLGNEGASERVGKQIVEVLL
jgi:lipid-A-disaccharide synthase